MSEMSDGPACPLCEQPTRRHCAHCSIYMCDKDQIQGRRLPGEEEEWNWVDSGGSRLR